MENEDRKRAVLKYGECEPQFYTQDVPTMQAPNATIKVMVNDFLPNPRNRGSYNARNPQRHVPP
ncbi:MAG TPA: hypothetical protein VD735_05695, partial [Candidatus Saccharimonadales bacterium]|nr:hypothetical protein [Candidatus Saccharimonadales bacterium]